MGDPHSLVPSQLRELDSPLGELTRHYIAHPNVEAKNLFPSLVPETLLEQRPLEADATAAMRRRAHARSWREMSVALVREERRST